MLFTINMINLDYLLKLSEPQFLLGKMKIIIYLRKLVFVSSGCHNKAPKTGWLTTNDI